MNRRLHIIALNVPYPPDYGGVIDIYYKLQALHSLGVGIVLHCFAGERQRAEELEELCEKVYYYERRTGWATNLSALPYNVAGRKGDGLAHNLLADNSPILFEGLHSCYHLADPRIATRLKIFRAGNIEHDYYRHLARSCREPLAKAFHYLEALRFKHYERVINSADIILGISLSDTEYFGRRFPSKRTVFMPAFHAGERITSVAGRSDFVLYHAKLSVPENERAALFLLREVFPRLAAPCIVAGMNPSQRILRAAARYPHISVVANPSEEEINTLVSEAQVNMLATFQATGLKLKLLKSLFSGRHVVADNLMLAGSGLDALCRIANGADEMVAACHELLGAPFTEEEISRRRSVLIPAYTSSFQAARLLALLDDSD